MLRKWIARDVIDVRSRNGKYGLIDAKSGDQIVPCEFDTIIACNPAQPVLCLCRAGRWGAIRVERKADRAIRWIAPCEYDFFDKIYWDYIFRREGEVRCWFDDSETVRVFAEASVENGYIRAKDDKYYYILRMCFGDEVWRCRKDGFRALLPDHARRITDDPSFVYMGEKNRVPLFQDATYAGCLLPDKRGGVVYCRDAPSVIMPIIVNGKNIVNIVQVDGGVNVWDGSAGSCTPGDADGYGEIVAELKITLKRNRTKTEKTYALPHGVFHFGDVVDFPEW